jgi:hypothetical protein
MIQNQYPSYDPLKTTDFASLPEFRGLNTHLGGYYDDDNTDFTDDIVTEVDRGDIHIYICLYVYIYIYIYVYIRTHLQGLKDRVHLTHLYIPLPYILLMYIYIYLCTYLYTGVEGQSAFDPSIYSPSILPDNTDIEDMDIGAIDLSFALSTDLDQDGDIKPYQYGADITDMVDRSYSPDSESSFGAQAGLSPNAVAFDPLLGYNGGQNDRKGESNGGPLLGYNGGQNDRKQGESDQELKQYYEMLQQQHEYNQYQIEYNQYSQSTDNATPPIQS